MSIGKKYITFAISLPLADQLRALAELRGEPLSRCAAELVAEGVRRHAEEIPQREQQ